MQGYKIERLAAWLFVGLVGLGVLYVGAKYLLAAFLPFLLAWGFAFLLRPAACALQRRLHLNRKLSATLLMVVFWSVLFFVVWLLASHLLGELKSFLLYLQQNPQVYTDFFARVDALLKKWTGLLPTGATEGASGSVESYIAGVLPEMIGRLLDNVSTVAGRLLLSLPRILLFLLVTVIASVYFSLDLARINRGALALFPEPFREKLRQARQGISRAFARYARSYLVLMGLTFALLLVGFWIIGVRYALLLAAVFAVVDLLPVLGVGTLLIPWGLFCLSTGQGRLGISLLVLYGVIALVRQLAEPKLVGESLGVPPLLMLVYLYGGLTLFGMWGVLLAPLAALVQRAVIGARTSGDNKKCATGATEEID